MTHTKGTAELAPLLDAQGQPTRAMFAEFWGVLGDLLKAMWEQEGEISPMVVSCEPCGEEKSGSHTKLSVAIADLCEVFANKGKDRGMQVQRVMAADLLEARETPLVAVINEAFMAVVPGGATLSGPVSQQPNRTEVVLAVVHSLSQCAWSLSDIVQTGDQRSLNLGELDFSPTMMGHAFDLPFQRRGKAAH